MKSPWTDGLTVNPWPVYCFRFTVSVQYINKTSTSSFLTFHSVSWTSWVLILGLLKERSSVLTIGLCRIIILLIASMIAFLAADQSRSCFPCWLYGMVGKNNFTNSFNPIGLVAFVFENCKAESKTEFWLTVNKPFVGPSCVPGGEAVAKLARLWRTGAACRPARVETAGNCSLGLAEQNNNSVLPLTWFWRHLTEVYEWHLSAVFAIPNNLCWISPGLDNSSANMCNCFCCCFALFLFLNIYTDLTLNGRCPTRVPRSEDRLS